MANMQRPQIHSNNTLVLEDIGEASHSYEIQIIGNITSSGEILGETEIDLKNISMPIKLEVEENNSIRQKNDKIQNHISIIKVRLRYL